MVKWGRKICVCKENTLKLFKSQNTITWIKGFAGCSVNLLPVNPGNLFNPEILFRNFTISQLTYLWNEFNADPAFPISLYGEGTRSGAVSLSNWADG